MLATDSLLVGAAHMAEGDEAPLATLAIGVPHYTIRVTAICVERRNLGVMAEYILRAMACGLTESGVIADFLGVSHEEVESEIAELSEGHFLMVQSDSKKIALMEKGRIAISNEGLRTAVLREVPCLIDAVTRQALIREPSSLVPRRRLHAGTLVLPAVPARPPRSDELNIADVKASLVNRVIGFDRSLEISRLGRIVRASSLFQSGFVMLKRGVHSVPTFCIDGATSPQLSQHLGAHPALQVLKQQLERQEKKVRHQLTTMDPRLRGQGLVDPAIFMTAVSKYVAWCNEADGGIKTAERSFRETAKELVRRSHWAGEDECHMLLRYATVTATRKLLLVAPGSSALMGLDVIEILKAVGARGVQVELHVSPEDMQSIQRTEDVKVALQRAQIISMPTDSGWCGISCDDAFVFVGCRTSISCTMGKTNALFGTVITNDASSEGLLRSLALSGVPVTVRRPARGLKK
jgi:hypothetical protein